MKLQDILNRIKQHPLDAAYWLWLVIFPFTFDSPTIWHGLAYGVFLWLGANHFSGLWGDKS